MYIRSACRSEFVDTDDAATALPEPVLLVEADHKVHPALTTRLELEAGAVVVHALAPEDATDIIKRGLRPTVVITGIDTGSDIDGLAFSDLVQQLRPGTPVVFATGELGFLRRRRLKPGESFAPRAFLPQAVRQVARRRR